MLDFGGLAPALSDYMLIRVRRPLLLLMVAAYFVGSLGLEAVASNTAALRMDQRVAMAGMECERRNLRPTLLRGHDHLHHRLRRPKCDVVRRLIAQSRRIRPRALGRSGVPVVVRHGPFTRFTPAANQRHRLTIPPRAAGVRGLPSMAVDRRVPLEDGIDHENTHL